MLNDKFCETGLTLCESCVYKKIYRFIQIYATNEKLICPRDEEQCRIR